MSSRLQLLVPLDLSTKMSSAFHISMPQFAPEIFDRMFSFLPQDSLLPLRCLNHPIGSITASGTLNCPTPPRCEDHREYEGHFEKYNQGSGLSQDPYNILLYAFFNDGEWVSDYLTR